MKNHLFLLIIGLGITFSSCTKVYYAEPQPQNVTALTAFPETFRGVFVNMDDMQENEDKPTVVFIEASRITSYEYREISLEKDSLLNSEKYEIRDSLIYDKSHHMDQGFPFKEKEGVVSFGYYTQSDYGLSDSLVLKNYKGNLYLSYLEEGKTEWISLLIEQMRDGSQTWWANDLEREENLLRKYVGLDDTKKIDNGNYLLKPKKKQLHKLVEAGGFQQRAFLFIKVEEKMEVAELPGVVLKK